MENLFSKTEDLAATIKEYVNARIDSLKLNAAEKSSVIVANAVARIIVVVLLIFFLVLGSIALSLVVGIWLGQAWAGFLAVSFFYLLVAIIVWAAKGKLIRMPVMNSMIHQLFKEHEEDK